MIRSPAFNVLFIRFSITLCTSLLLTSCNNHYSSDPSPAPTQPAICSGLGCIKAPGKPTSRLETHKATKDEKIRARRGESPDFGSEELNIGIPLTF